MRIDNPNITAVIITNDNLECINAIESVLDSCNEVIVVNTVETTEVNKAVEKFGDKVKVVYFKWCNDFSRARNYGIKKASGDWILTIDSDEILETKIEYVDDKYLGYFTKQNNKGEMLPTARLFKSHLRYKNKVHESIDHALTSANSCNSDIIIKHTGYEVTEAEMMAKLKRNYDIMMTDKKNPIYNLHMGALHFANEEYDKALICYDKAMKDRLNDSHFAVIQNSIHICHLKKGSPLRTLLRTLKRSLVYEPFQIYARANIVEHLFSVINDENSELYVGEIRSELGKIERIWESKVSNLLYNELNIDENYINEKYAELRKWDNTIERIAI